MVVFLLPWNNDMRACFLGQNVCALGYGVAMVQTLPLPENPDAKTRDSDPAIPPPDVAPLPNRMFEHFRRQLPHYS